MKTRIRPMAADVVECVAAGEVIVRPASVAKELLENSADATSSSALLEVVGGGHDMLRVTDDGDGIHPDDLRLSLASHTTSKLVDTDDLNRICTYGFRGEALASIRAVSRLSLASALQDGRGLVVRASADEVGEPEPIEMPKGTRVQVEDLFFNVPARRKFLATPVAELRHIRRIFHQFALARPEMDLQLRVDGKRTHRLEPAAGRDGLQQRLVDLVGSDRGLMPLEAEAAGMALHGWMGSPDKLQSRPLQQYFFVNDRPVFDKLLLSAARTALSSSLGRSGYPFLAVWLQVEPAHLDVNVHPTKEEVRFLYPRAVHGLMRSAVAAALAGRSPSRHLSLRTAAGSGQPQVQPRVATGGGAAPNLWVQSQPAAEAEAAPSAGLSLAPQTGEALEFMSLGRPLAQLHKIFILAENSEGLVIVDAHAAHERCLLEQARDQLASGQLAVQPMLTPLHLDLGVELAEVVEEHGDSLQVLGLEIDRTGQSQAAVRATPALLAGIDTDELVRRVLADLAETGTSTATSDALVHLVGNLCCRAATRAGIELPLEEMNELLRAMERLPHSAYCNHGRPSWHQIDVSELNRLCHRGR